MSLIDHLLASPEARASYRNSALLHRLVDIVDHAERSGDPDPIATLGRALATAMNGKAEWERLALIRAEMEWPSTLIVRRAL